MALQDKGSIRDAMRQRRRSVSPEDRKFASRTICEKLRCNPRLDYVLWREGPVAVYIPTADEIDIVDFIVNTIGLSCMVVAPRWNGTSYELVEIQVGNEDELEKTDRDLVFDDLKLVKGPMGVLEPVPGKVWKPEEIAAWIVPGLAFSPDGKRIGYGGGWYDRLLSKANPKAPKIGVAYSFQVVEELPSEDFDCNLTEIVDDSDQLGAAQRGEMEKVWIHGVAATVARTFCQRAKGLLGRSGLEKGTGMLILKCNCIHTCFMRFPIDAVFLDADGNVVKTVRNIRPWRLCVWGGWRAKMVLELDSRTSSGA